MIEKIANVQFFILFSHIIKMLKIYSSLHKTVEYEDDC